MRRLTVLWILALFACATLPAFAEGHEQIAQEVIAITKAQWAAEMAKKPVTEMMQDVAAEYTEFNSDSPTRLDGKELNVRLAEAFRGSSGEIVAAEMANPKVQVYGDVAILTYNYIGMSKSKDGEVEPALAKSTRVYAKKDGKWKLVHANFAPVN